MSDLTLAPRQRPLWPLFIAPALVVVAAIAWSGFWFYAASQVDVIADAWRAREAKSGRVFDCAHRSVAGFPFRLEIRCDGVSVSLVSQTAAQPPQAPVTARLGEVLAVAQVYDPKLVIAEFTAPAGSFEQGAQQPSFVVNWSKGRSSVVGLPATRRARPPITPASKASWRSPRAVSRGCIPCWRSLSMPMCGRWWAA